MDAVGFRVYFGDGAGRVEWPGFIKWSASVEVTPSATLAGGVHATESESNILTVKRIADHAAEERGFWNWEKTADGRFAQKVLTLELVDADNTPVRRYELVGAWPKSLEGPALNATGNGIAIETIELVYERLEIR